MSGCTGACCSAFPLSHDLEYLWLHWHHITDGALIASMLIALTHTEARARMLAVDSQAAMKVDAGEEYFTCRHWDRATRRCRIYHRRPAMCRNHGTSERQRCQHCGTTTAAAA